MNKAKYKLIRAGKMRIHRTNEESRFYQLQALRDIPKYGVKAGDLGGYVTDKYILSHEGSCWIADNAQVIGNVSISEDAYVGGNAVVWVYSLFLEIRPSSPIFLKGNIQIKDDAFVESCYDRSKRNFISSIFQGNAIVSGNAKLMNVYRIHGSPKIYGEVVLKGTELIAGNSEIHGNANIGSGVTIEDESQVYGNASLSDDCAILGNSKVFDDAKIFENAKIIDSEISGNGNILRNQVVRNSKINGSTVIAEIEPLEANEVASEPLPPTPRGKVYLRTLKDVEEKIAAYETDIVKIIKYPVMIDRTDPFTQAMVASLNNAQRWAEDPNSEDFKDAVKALENAFLAAESNALKISTTLFSDTEKKKTQTAHRMLAVASNEASSEQEKKVAFQQAFKQLEGIIAVPEVAIDAFRVKIGLKELEA